MLVNKVELNQKLLLGSLIAGGITNKRKLAAWEKMTDAVNSVWSEERTLSGVMRRPKESQPTDVRHQQHALHLKNSHSYIL